MRKRLKFQTAPAVQLTRAVFASHGHASPNRAAAACTIGKGTSPMIAFSALSLSIEICPHPAALPEPKTAPPLGWNVPGTFRAEGSLRK